MDEPSSALFPEFFKQPRGVIWDVKDADGRPFGEANASAEAREGVEMDYRRCPYSGSRLDKAMNVSALRQITENWDAMLADVAHLRADYVRRSGAAMNVWHLWRFAQIAAALPAFLVRTGFREREVPGRIGGMFKAIQGIFMTTQAAFMAGGLAMDRAIDADEFIRLTEEHNVFVGGNHACSGPPHMVKRFVEVVLGGAQEPAGPPASTLDEVLRDADRYHAYGEEALRMRLVVDLLAVRAARALDAMRVALARGGTTATKAADRRAAELRQRIAAEPGGLDAHEALLRGLVQLETDVSLTSASPDHSAVLAARELAIEAGAPLASAQPTLEAMLGAALEYLGFEREALALINVLQRRIDAALGRATARAIDSAVLAEAHPLGVREMLLEHACLDAIETPAGPSFAPARDVFEI